jgi:hypothetical protein
MGTDGITDWKAMYEKCYMQQAGGIWEIRCEAPNLMKFSIGGPPKVLSKDIYAIYTLGESNNWKVRVRQGSLQGVYLPSWVMLA